MTNNLTEIIELADEQTLLNLDEQTKLAIINTCNLDGAAEITLLQTMSSETLQQLAWNQNPALADIAGYLLGKAVTENIQTLAKRLDDTETAQQIQKAIDFALKHRLGKLNWLADSHILNTIAQRPWMWGHTTLQQQQTLAKMCLKAAEATGVGAAEKTLAMWLLIYGDGDAENRKQLKEVIEKYENIYEEHLTAIVEALTSEKQPVPLPDGDAIKNTQSLTEDVLTQFGLLNLSVLIAAQGIWEKTQNLKEVQKTLKILTDVQYSDQETETILKSFQRQPLNQKVERTWKNLNSCLNDPDQLSQLATLVNLLDTPAVNPNETGVLTGSVYDIDEKNLPSAVQAHTPNMYVVPIQAALQYEEKHADKFQKLLLAVMEYDARFEPSLANYIKIGEANPKAAEHILNNNPDRQDIAMLWSWAHLGAIGAVLAYNTENGGQINLTVDQLLKAAKTIKNYRSSYEDYHTNIREEIEKLWRVINEQIQKIAKLWLENTDENTLKGLLAVTESTKGNLTAEDTLNIAKKIVYPNTQNRTTKLSGRQHNNPNNTKQH